MKNNANMIAGNVVRCANVDHEIADDWYLLRSLYVVKCVRSGSHDEGWRDGVEWV
jgi:hypothetical protein